MGRGVFNDVRRALFSGAGDASFSGRARTRGPGAWPAPLCFESPTAGDVLVAGSGGAVGGTLSTGSTTVTELTFVEAGSIGAGGDSAGRERTEAVSRAEVAVVGASRKSPSHAPSTIASPAAPKEIPRRPRRLERVAPDSLPSRSPVDTSLDTTGSVGGS